MDDKPFIAEETFEIKGQDGEMYSYILSNFDAVAGRHIVTQYPVNAISKTGEYAENEKLMVKLMSYVAVVLPNGHKLRLSTIELINNHVPDTETLITIEMKMMEKNFSFFRNGRFQELADGIVQMLSRKILEMLTLSSEPSSPPEKPPSTN